MSTSASHATSVSERMSRQKFKCQVTKNTNTIVTKFYQQTVKLKSNFCSTSLGYNLHEPFAYNVLRLPDGFYFGLSWHCRFVKNIAIKIKKLLTEIYIAIFFRSNFIRASNLINLLSAQNKIYLVAAVSGSGKTASF